MNINEMKVVDFIQMATKEGDVELARAKCILKGSEETDGPDEDKFWAGVNKFKEEFEARGNYLQ